MIFHFQITLVSDISNYLVIGNYPKQWGQQDKKNFLVEVRKFFWDNPCLYKYNPHQIIRKCVPDHEITSVVSIFHFEAYGDHFSLRKAVAKILQSGFYQPPLFRDTREFYKSCDRCQTLGAILHRNMMPLNQILIIDIFDYGSIDFMEPFPSSFGN